ncbi:MAG: hypothetical protein KJ607_07275 [Bacteroidetes bacterium]|nr:hypothetical protein [Bacteroidota bacterium]
MVGVKTVNYIGFIPLLHINDYKPVIYLTTEIEFNRSSAVGNFVSFRK